MTIATVPSGLIILEESPASVSKYVLKALENLKVDVKLEIKVMGLV